MKVDLTMQKYEVLNTTDLNANTVEQSCEMSYSSGTGKFYVTDAANNLYSFTLPDADGVTNYQQIDLVGGGITVGGLGIYGDDKFDWNQEDVNQKYNVTIAPTQNGTVQVNPTSAPEGALVSITAQPDKGYQVDAIQVVDANGNAVTVNNNSFAMPKGGVTVTVTFKLVEQPPPSEDPQQSQNPEQSQKPEQSQSPEQTQNPQQTQAPQQSQKPGAGDSTQDNVPPTADTTHIFLYVMVLVAASSLLAGLALARKKHPR